MCHPHMRVNILLYLQEVDASATVLLHDFQQVFTWSTYQDTEGIITEVSTDAIDSGIQYISALFLKHIFLLLHDKLTLVFHRS